MKEYMKAEIDAALFLAKNELRREAVDDAIVDANLQKFLPIAQKMTMELLEVVDGCVLSVSVHCAFDGNTMHGRRLIAVKPDFKKEHDIQALMAEGLWRVGLRTGTPHWTEKILESEAFKTIKAKFEAVAAAVSEFDFQQAMDRNRKQENAQKLAAVKDELYRVAMRAMEHGASFKEVQDLINQALIDWTHQV